MTLPVVQNVGTILRHHNDALQRIVPVGEAELASIAIAKLAGKDVIDALTALNAGTSPIKESVEVSPNTNFKTLSKAAFLSATNRLSTVTRAVAEDDERGQFDKIEVLKKRISELDAAIAASASRMP